VYDSSEFCVLNTSILLLSLLEHTFYPTLRQTTLVIHDCDAIWLASCLVSSSKVETTVGIDVEGDLNLRDTTRCGGDSRQLEFPEEVVILRACTLTLEYLDEHTGLVVGVCGEDFRLLGRYGRVPLDQRGHDTTSGFDTKRQRCNIE